MQSVRPFIGQHCETTATGTLLGQLGIELSEPMLFGLGEGLSFIFWQMKGMERPFIGGRIKPDALTENIARNLKLKLNVKETASGQKAWEGVRALVDAGRLVGLKLDSYHLEYFSRPIHFAGHYVALYGYDQDYAYLVDTQQQGGQVRTSLRSLALARAEKGPMASKNLYYTLERTEQGYDLEQATLSALRNNAAEYLNPPISNISYKGILKTSSEIVTWFKRSQDVATDFQTTALLMERAGTGGALFRNLYRDFLGECCQLHERAELRQAHESFVEIAGLWSSVAALLDQAGSSGSIAYIHEASALLKDLSGKERAAMDLVQQAVK